MAEAEGGGVAQAPLSSTIPSGKDTVWFDVSSLLQRASQGPSLYPSLSLSL